MVINLQGIANHLGVAKTAITKIQEWKYVIFVVVRGMGGRFVSKQHAALQQVGAYDLAEMFANDIRQGNTFQANIWNKKFGEVRIYVSLRRNDRQCGYIRIQTSGSITFELTHKSDAIRDLIHDTYNQFQVFTTVSTQIVEECWECGATYTSHGNVHDDKMGCHRCA